MQTSHLDIYKMLSKETGKSEQKYKDIGSFIFKETSKMLKNPASLIVKLKGVGSWHLRKKRMDIIVAEWESANREIPPKREDFFNDAAFDEAMYKHNMLLIFRERLKEYEKYLQIKKEIREKRNETGILLEPNTEED